MVNADVNEWRSEWMLTRRRPARLSDGLRPKHAWQLALGLLIGVERGWGQREMPEGQRVAGFWTFGVVSLLGMGAVVAPERSVGVMDLRHAAV
jgi:hypothetical protein